MTTSAPSSPDGDDAYPTVLVVDDEPAIQELASIFLEDKGYTVRQACDNVIAFAEAYITLFEQVARDGVEGIGPNPVTEFNSISVSPGIGDGFSLAELACVTGDVQLGEASTVGKQSSICADEGTPIVIGRRARIRRRVTFHALEHTSVQVGDNAQIGDSNGVHGSINIGDNVVSEDDGVIFQATIREQRHCPLRRHGRRRLRPSRGFDRARRRGRHQPGGGTDPLSANSVEQERIITHDHRFDIAVRVLAERASRRGALRGVIAALAAGMP